MNCEQGRHQKPDNPDDENIRDADDVEVKWRASTFGSCCNWRKPLGSSMRL